MTTRFDQIKELKQMLNEGLLTEGEFSQMKNDLLKENDNLSQHDQKPTKSHVQTEKGVGWREVISVLIGPIGGIYYLFTHRSVSRKIIVLLLSFMASGLYLSLLNISAGTFQNSLSNSQSKQSKSSSASSSSKSQAEVISVGTFGDVKSDWALRVNRSEILDSIQTGNPYIKPVESKGGKLVVVYLTVRNTGNESGNMFWTQFQLRDNQGRLFDNLEDFQDISTISMWAKEQGLEDAGNQLFPGGTANVVQVFRISPDAKGMQLLSDNQVFEIGLETGLMGGESSYSEPGSTNLASTSPSESANQPASTGRVIQAKDGYANLRSQPSTEVGSVMMVPNGTAIAIIGEQTNSAGQLWYKVDVNGQVGWIYSELIP
ncbi:MAG: SH3 domain-containing protein [Nodosilinea sp. LVE1205-7]|jgi:hypothetical protein